MIVASAGNISSKSIGISANDRAPCKRNNTNEIVKITTDSIDTSNETRLYVENVSTSTTSSIKINTPNIVTLPGINKQVYGDKKVDSTERLRQLRQLLASNNYDAYLVGPNDEHGSEIVSDYDQRLKFISGFSGSNGYALILLDKAVLFTDGRYELQADLDLDCNWDLVVSRNILQDIHRWLEENIPTTGPIKLAADARLMTLDQYDYLQKELKTKFNSDLILISQDLVDVVWNNENSSGSNDSNNPRPKPQEPIFVHPIQFNGNISWQEKVAKLVDYMNKLSAYHYVISRLEDIAWLLNLRGADIPNSPLFKAYLFVSRYPSVKTQGSKISEILLSDSLSTTKPVGLQSPQVLQVPARESVRITLYVDLKKIDRTVRDHLHIDNGTFHVGKHNPSVVLDGSSANDPLTIRIQVELKDYDVFIMDLGNRLSPNPTARQMQGRLILDWKANVAIHVIAKPYEDLYVIPESLICRLKAVKTDGEVEGMRKAHWRDSLAISMLLAQLEHDISQKKQFEKWTEVSASKELEFYRSLMDFNWGQSFDSISAYGSNSAIVHYHPKETDKIFIKNESTYLLDSGGQYLDGTTDITRTVHFGEPNEYQRETYTRVLMGAIDCMSLIIPTNIGGSNDRISDLIARRHLMEVGLNYNHGTGHGIGLFSLVHEPPNLIVASTQSQSGDRNNRPTIHMDPVPMQANMFTSVEPGYYKENDFGIRLENIVVTKRYQPLYRSENVTAYPSLRLEPISLVPFEPKLIKFEMLSNQHKAWLNSYNVLVRYRLTEQINHYRAKLMLVQQQSQKSNKLAVQVNGVTSSSKLYHHLMQPSNMTSNNQTISRTVQSRSAEIARLQERLEQTHKWIMANTEIIPLDIPRGHVQRRRIKGQNTEDLDNQRLLMAYMSSLPFSDSVGSTIIAKLANLETNPNSDDSALGPKMEQTNNVSSIEHGSSRPGSLTTCIGTHCDLLLLTRLNPPTRSESRVGSDMQNAQKRSYNNNNNDNNKATLTSRYHDDIFDEEEEQHVDGNDIPWIFGKIFKLKSSNESVSCIPGVYVIIGIFSLLVAQIVLSTMICRRKSRQQTFPSANENAQAMSISRISSLE